MWNAIYPQGFCAAGSGDEYKHQSRLKHIGAGGAQSTGGPFAAPHKRCRRLVPATGGRFEPVNDLSRSGRMLAFEARRSRMRWIDSAIFSQEPPKGVYNGRMP